MNKKEGILKYTESLILFIIWIAIISIPIFIFQLDEEISWDKVLIAWTGLLPIFILFVINHFILIPVFLFKNKKSLYLILAFILVIIFSSFLFIQEKTGSNGPPPQEGRPYPPPNRNNNLEFRQEPPPHPAKDSNSVPPMVNIFIVSILVIGFDTGLRMRFRWSKLEQEKTLLEKENIQTQLAFLQNQVSPHFFMNTLNNIHALIDIDQEEAKQSIIKLSKLMRHLLYDSQTELVPLKKEFEFIQSYINLMKLRFSESINIKLTLPDQIPDTSIPPLLFTSFVENAFKHGISYQNPTFIDIAFSYTTDYLIFEIRNINHRVKSENRTSGIGIDNARKRLDILYGKKYSLKIEDNIDDFVVILKIPV